MKPKNVYLLLCVLGLAIPYSQFVPWLHENGMNLALLVRQLFANRISAFFGLDVLVVRSALGVYACGGTPALRAFPLASDCRSLRGGS
jgi:hypothetical protein